MAFGKLVLLTMATPSLGGDQTSVTTDLNSQIESGNGAYNKGKGILVRTPDFFANSGNVVVPGTFWVNDITTPSQLYPAGNPWCPHGSTDGFEDLSWSKCPLPNGPWEYATVAAVIGADTMPKFFKDFDNIQQSSWGWGVFYPTDANSADKRCNYENNEWNCPGGTVDSTGKFTADPSKKGAGFFPMGNPDAGLGGGGAGCHFDTNSNLMDQVDATDSKNQNLVKDGNCQCNYAFNKDWNAWVQDWINNKVEKAGFEWRSWLHGGKKAPSWAVDPTMCWVNNPKDMIALQNAMYMARDGWNNGMTPQQDQTGRRYWGWNEVPITRTVADDVSSWTAVMVKIPAQLCGGKADSLSCLNGQAQTQLEKDIDSFVSKGKLLTGQQHSSSRPGSYMVIVREFRAYGGAYHRQFFCENWSSPGHKYKIVFIAAQGKSLGACYLDHDHSSVVV